MLSELIPAAADLIGWKVDTITSACFGAQTGFGGVRILFIRVADFGVVLDLCLPLARAVEEPAVREMVAVNGAGTQIVSSAWFSEYEGSDGRRYLGAFVRVPIPPTFLDPRPIGDLLRAGLDHVWAASMMFGQYIEYCEDHGKPAGCVPLEGMDVVPARPADPFDQDDLHRSAESDD